MFGLKLLVLGHDLETSILVVVLGIAPEWPSTLSAPD